QRVRTGDRAVVAGRARLYRRERRVARAAGRPVHQVEQGVLLAVDADVDQLQDVPGGGSLAPQLVAGRGPQDGDPLLQRRLERLVVGVADEQDVPAARVLLY